MNGPELWDQILAEMPNGAVVAGGAVRDYFLGVEPKDIDVFMGSPFDIAGGPSVEDFEIMPMDGRCGLFRIDSSYERLEEYTSVAGIELVSSGTMLGYKVDAIVMTDFDAETLVEGFDFGITRCWYDGEIHDTPAAAADRANFTVTRMLFDRPERSLTRFARFNERMGRIYRYV